MNKIHLSQLWFLINFVLAYYNIVNQNVVFLLFNLIILFHAGHELLHSSLFKNKVLSQVFGIATYSIFFHNYYVLRSSHLSHHLCGRNNKDECLVDHRFKNYDLFQRFEYYARLCGLNYFLYIVGGFFFALSKKLFEKYFFCIRYRQIKKIRLAQIFVGINIVFIFSFLSLYQALLVFFFYGFYWGVSQNAAHYALQVGGEDSQFASRTFKLNGLVHFFFFGSTFSHLEHHLFPTVPGVYLNSAEYQSKIANKISGQPNCCFGFFSYIKALFRQFETPTPSIESWKHISQGHL